MQNLVFSRKSYVTVIHAVQRVCVHTRACTHTHTRLQHASIATPPKKRQKREKKSKVERAMENTLAEFLKYQTEAEERFQKREEERWKQEMELGILAKDLMIVFPRQQLSLPCPFWSTAIWC